MASSSPPFNGKTFVLELGRETSFKARQQLINYLREQQAHISYILTASTDYVLVTNDVDTYKTRRAKQLGLPLVNIEYVHECRRLLPGQTPTDINKFIIKSAEDMENFTKTGTIPVTGSGIGSRTSAAKINKFDLTKIKLWNSTDINLPRFDDSTHCEIGKWAIFKETNDNSDVFFALELQIIPEQYYDRTTSDYRLRFRYEKQTIIGEGQQQGKRILIQYAFSDDPNEQQQLFASYYYRVATMPRVTRIREMLPDKLGSKLLLRSLFAHRIDTQMLDENVCQMVESLWLESIGDLNQILSVPPESIALKTIIEAEAALLELKSTNDSSAALRFYLLIPHRSEFVVDLIKNRRVLTEKNDLCQMLRDMLTINELTNWNIKASIEAKYRALKCHIETLDNSTSEFRNIVDLIQSSTDHDEKVVVHHVFNVAKQTDALNFRTSLSNQRQLFHGSKYNNFLGILSRGLAMPKMVVDELGITRTDIGCLGYGIYFSDSVSTSLKYTTASTTRPGRRLLCICQVALGESANYYSFSPTLIKPPDGTQSTHGVKRTDDNHSMFTDNEYAIYQLDQQRLLYIVEVSWAPKDVVNIELERLPIVHDQQHALKLSEHVEVPLTIEDEVIQVVEQDYGLICPSSGKLVPLKSFHIRAQIVDATVEVVLYQVYHNTSSTPIEAKYVFPLDENSTVCGFEAHLNNKVIKGVVKEKEQAKQEYREAIEKGHGAYLMNQEQAEVFSVAVGNLPANNEVIIKITYVAELEIENGDIIFRLPAKMASWQSKQAIETRDQSTVRSIDITDEKVEFSLKASLRMPYEIIKLFSPTHRLRRKLTDCLAMIELVDNVLLDRDFVLSITLKSANLPRMSNEIFSLSDNEEQMTLNNNESQACMLTFYPRFETLTNSNEHIEMIFLVDVSNSMDGGHVQQAKQLTHLFLTNMKVDDGNTHFNIVTFGSDNDECFPISTPATKENLDKAKHFVLHSLVHRGNTDLFAVLQRYSLLPSLSKLGRQFLLLSDGHINDLKSILVLFEQQSNMRRDRLFTCSIGNIANKHDLKQLARGASGGGLATVFDSNYRSRWKTKVINILEHVRQPCVTSISIDWHGTVDEEQKFNMQAPKMIRSLFNGMRLTVYRFIRNCHKATLTAIIDGQEFVTTVFSSMMTMTKGRILHCLTARAIIDDFDNGLLHMDESENELIKVQCKQNLIDLSIKHSVVSTYTSFVAIEERDAKKDIQTPQPGVCLLDVMLDRDVDLLPYIGWDGETSHLASIKQNLIDARILLDSASIQSKKETIVDIEQLCENMSYRSGDDAKFDMMMSIIRTYRYSLHEPEKANQLENKMREDLINEMVGGTLEERQALQQRCDANNLKIASDKPDEQQWKESQTSNFIDFVEELEGIRPTTKDITRMPSSNNNDEHTNNELNGIQKQIANEKINQSLESTRRMRGLAAEYQEIGGKTMIMLSAQDEKLNLIEAGLDNIHVGMNEAEKNLTNLQNSTSVISEGPSVTIKESQLRMAPNDGMSSSGYIPRVTNDDCEEEMDDNLHLVHSYIDNLKAMALIMDDMIAKQNKQIQHLELPTRTTGKIMRENIATMNARNELLYTPEESPENLCLYTLPLFNDPMAEETVPPPALPLPPQQPATSLKISKSNYNPDPVSQTSTIFAQTAPPPPASISSFAPPALHSQQGQQQQQSQMPRFEAMSFNKNTKLPDVVSIPASTVAAPTAPAFPLFGSTSGNSNAFSFGKMSQPASGSRSLTDGLGFGARPSTTFFDNNNNNNNNNASFYTSTHQMQMVLPPPPACEIQTYASTMSMMHSWACTQELPFGQPMSTKDNSSHSSSLFSLNGGDSNESVGFSSGAPPIPYSHPPAQSFASFSFGAPPLPPPPPPQRPPIPKSSAASSSPFVSGGRSGSKAQFRAVPKSQSNSRNLDERMINAGSSFSTFKHIGHIGAEHSESRAREMADSFANKIESTHSALPSQTKVDKQSDEHDMKLQRQDELSKCKVLRKKKLADKKVSTQSSNEHVPISRANRCDVLLLDVIPLGLGIEDIHGHMCTLIRRNTTIPTRTQLWPVFTNAYAYQTTVTIRIFEGEHKLTKYNTFLGEFTLSGLTSNYAAQTLEIAICMDIDANGLLCVDAQEARSSAKASFTIDTSEQKRLTRNDIEQHITFVNSDATFAAKSVFDRKSNDPLYMLNGQTDNMTCNFSGELVTSLGLKTGVPLLGTLKDIQSTQTMIEELIKLQSEDGSFMLNKGLADVFHINVDLFDGLERYLREQGFNSLALNIRNTILRLIGTGIILIWLVLQTQGAQKNTLDLLLNTEQIKTHLCNYLPKNMSEQIDKAVKFYEQTHRCNGIYCGQLELSDPSWGMFIQHSLLGIDRVNN